MKSEDYNAKLQEIFQVAIEKIAKLDNLSINKSRAEFIQKVCHAMILMRSVQFGEISSRIEGNADEKSHLRRMHRFIDEYDLDYRWVMSLILLLLPKTGKVTLSIDRTEWEFGSQNHNVLVVSVYCHGIGFPIWFECLDNNGGNSDTDDRAYVVLACVAGLGKERIKCIVGDCEFIGEEWIKFLMVERINFYFDVRANQYFTHECVKYQISAYMKWRKKKLLDNVHIMGHWLSIAMMHHKKGKKRKVLAIVTNTKAEQALGNYKSRWSIEVLFENLKTRGFNLEKTHIKKPERLRRLFALCAIAFTLCVIVGKILDKIKPIKKKNNGYKSNSYFRYGLDFTRKASKKVKDKDKIKLILKEIKLVFDKILEIIETNFLLKQKIVM
jgi:Transposase DDE domain